MNVDLWDDNQYNDIIFPQYMTKSVELTLKEQYTFYDMTHLRYDFKHFYNNADISEIVIIFIWFLMPENHISNTCISA